MSYDFETTEKRSNIMKKIRSTDTKPEIKLRKALWHQGYRYRKNYKELPGNPDIAITKYNLAIFVDGEFWHGYNWEEKKEKISSNRDYWIPKIEGNMERDEKYNQELKEMGWEILRFWATKEVENNLEKCVSIVEEKIKEMKNKDKIEE